MLLDLIANKPEEVKNALMEILSHVHHNTLKLKSLGQSAQEYEAERQAFKNMQNLVNEKFAQTDKNTLAIEDLDLRLQKLQLTATKNFLDFEVVHFLLKIFF